MDHGRSLGSFLLPFALLLPIAGAPAQGIAWWEKDFDSALEASADSKAGMLLLYFWQQDHPDCSAMFGGTMSEEKVLPVLGEFVCMGVQRGTDAGRQLFLKFHVEQVPSTFFLTPQGEVVDAIPGYLPTEAFLATIARIRKGEGTVAALRQAVEAAPEDLAALLALMQKLRTTGDREGAGKVIDAIVEKDPKCKSEQAAEAMLVRLIDEVFAPDTAPQSWDLEPLYGFLRKQKNKRILFLGYRRLAEGAYQQENLKDWAKFAERAWKSIPDAEVQTWGQAQATIACKHGKELDKINKKILKLMLKISESSFDITKKEQPDDKPYLAWAMYLHAGVLKECGQRKEAFKLLDEAIAADPKNETYKKAKDWWLQGN